MYELSNLGIADKVTDKIDKKMATINILSYFMVSGMDQIDTRFAYNHQGLFTEFGVHAYLGVRVGEGHYSQ